MLPRKPALILCVLIASDMPALAQDFLPQAAITIGSSEVEKIAGVDVAPNGDVYGVGTIYGPGTPDLLLIKQRADGSIAFAKIYDFGVYCSGHTVAVLPNGDVAVSAYIETRYVDALTMRLDSAGNPLWARVWGSGDWDPGNGLAVDNAGNIYQNVASIQSGSIDNVQVKYDGNGNVLDARSWHLNINNAQSSEGVVDNDGNTYVPAMTGNWTMPGNQDLLVIKRRPNGTMAWDAVWAGSGTEYGRGVAVDETGNVYVCGTTSSFGAGAWDVVVVKFDSTGTLQWQRTWGGSGDDYTSAIWIAPDGSLCVVGETDSYGTGGFDLALLRYSTTGDLLTQHTWGSASDESASGLSGSRSEKFALGGGAFNCDGLWQEAAGIEGIPSGVVSNNVGFDLTPIGSAQAVVPTVSDLAGIECSGGGGSDMLLLTFRYCVEPQFCEFDAQDVNCDGVITVVDVVLTVGAAFRNQPPNTPCCPFK